MTIVAVVSSRPLFLSALEIFLIVTVVLKSCPKVAFASQCNRNEPQSGTHSNTCSTKILRFHCPCHYKIMIFEYFHYFLQLLSLYLFIVPALIGHDVLEK